MKLKDKKAIFLLRLGVGVMLLLWSLDKIFAPELTVKIFQGFYKVPITTDTAVAIGIVQAIISIAIIVGFMKTWSYGLGLAMNAVSIGSTWQQLLDPFGKNHLFIAGITVLLSTIALFMLREHDTFMAVDKKK